MPDKTPSANVILPPPGAFRPQQAAAPALDPRGEACPAPLPQPGDTDPAPQISQAATPATPAPVPLAAAGYPLHPRSGFSDPLAYEFKSATGGHSSVLIVYNPLEGSGKRRETVVYRYLAAADGPSWVALEWSRPAPLYGLDQVAARPGAPVVVLPFPWHADRMRALMLHCVVVAAGECAANTDWRPLAGRSVIVWPGGGDAGASEAAAAIECCKKAGAATCYQVNMDTVKAANGGDVRIAIAEWSAERMLRLMSDPSFLTRPTKLPIGFSARDGLLWFDDPYGGSKPIPVCGHLEVVGSIRDHRGGNWGVLVAWKDRDGKHHEHAIPPGALTGEGKAVRDVLAFGGFRVPHSRDGKELLQRYLLQSDPEVRAQGVDRVGWHDGSYVLTDGAVQPTHAKERIVLQLDDAPSSIDGRGTVESWKETLGAWCVGNSRAAFCVATAFAAPLMDLLDEQGGGFHLLGDSSTGKSTATRMADSVFHAREQLPSWLATGAGLEDAAALHNDGLLVLDEINQVDGSEAGRIAYMLANGVGKKRGGEYGRRRPPLHWRVLFLSNGEKTLRQHLAESGQAISPGMLNRLPDIPAETGQHGVFENLHGFARGAVFAQAIQSAARRHRATVGPAFVRQLVDLVAGDRPALIEKLAARRAAWLGEYHRSGAKGVDRVAQRFALVAVAGELATTMQLLPWPDGEAFRAAATCFNAWLDHRGGSEESEELEAIRRVRLFLQLHGSSRFVSTMRTGGAAVPNQAGYTKKSDDGTLYLIWPQVWQEEVCKGLSATTVAKLLLDRKWLVPAPDGKLSHTEWIPARGSSLRFYAVSDSILS